MSLPIRCRNGHERTKENTYICIIKGSHVQHCKDCDRKAKKPRVKGARRKVRPLKWITSIGSPAWNECVLAYARVMGMEKVY